MSRVLELLGRVGRRLRSWSQLAPVNKPQMKKSRRGKSHSQRREAGESKSVSELVRDPSYHEQFGKSVATWMVEHQTNIIFRRVRWMGIRAVQNAFDLWILQEIIHQRAPQAIVEIGSLAGGTTLYFAHLLDILGEGVVISVDVDRSDFQAKHPRIIEVTGDCAADSVVSRVRGLCAGKRTMVLHDADHSKAAVLRDLELYSPMVSPRQYFVVCDGIVDVFDPATKLDRHKPGPLAAIREFLKQHPEFRVDLSRERYEITSNPWGYLERAGRAAQPPSKPNTAAGGGDSQGANEAPSATPADPVPAPRA